MAANIWLIEVRQGDQGSGLGEGVGEVRARYAWKAGTFDVQPLFTGSPTPREAELGKIDGALSMILEPWGDERTYNSVEATWRGIMPAIEPEDIVQIYTTGFQSGETATTYYPRFVGRVEVLRNPRDRTNEPQQYRAVGLHISDFDTSVPDNTPLAEGQDLGEDLAFYYIDNYRPNTVLNPSAGDLNVGVTNTAKVNANYGTLGELLDALAELGETGGKWVKPGVRPDRTFFFEERGTAQLEIDEADPDTNVSWPEPQTQGVVSGVRWLVADGTQDQRLFEEVGVSLDTPDILSHLSDSDVTDYRERHVPLSTPDALQVFEKVDATYSLEDGTLIASFIGEDQDGTPTLDRVHDDDPTSYIVAEGVFINLRATLPASGLTARDIVAVSIHLREDTSGVDMDSHRLAVVARRTNADDEVWTIITGRTVFLGVGEVYVNEIGSINIQELLVWGDRARDDGAAVNDTGHVSLRMVGAGSDASQIRWAIEDFRVWTLGTGNLDAIAELEYKFPPEETVEVDLPGQQLVLPRLQIATRDDETLSNLLVDQYELLISDTEGVRTKARMGDGAVFDAITGAQAERIRDRDVKAETRAVKKALSGRRR